MKIEQYEFFDFLNSRGIFPILVDRNLCENNLLFGTLVFKIDSVEFFCEFRFNKEKKFRLRCIDVRHIRTTLIQNRPFFHLGRDKNIFLVAADMIEGNFACRSLEDEQKILAIPAMQMLSSIGLEFDLLTKKDNHIKGWDDFHRLFLNYKKG